MAQGQQHLDDLLASQDMLMQPFFPAVIDPGEHSLVFIDGAFTHAVRRRPALGADLSTRMQSVPSQKAPFVPQLLVPQEEELHFAQKVLARLSSPILYARVDIVRDENANLRLMEVELVEPGLWLPLAPSAVERFADAITKKVADASRSAHL